MRFGIAELWWPSILPIEWPIRKSWPNWWWPIPMLDTWSCPWNTINLWYIILRVFTSLWILIARTILYEQCVFYYSLVDLRVRCPIRKSSIFSVRTHLYVFFPSFLMIHLHILAENTCEICELLKVDDSEASKVKWNVDKLDRSIILLTLKKSKKPI